MRNRLHYISFFVVLVCSFIASPNSLPAQERDPGLYDYSHNHLPWFTIESDHFLIHFQQGNSRPAQVISRIAEEIYPDITQLYQYEPDSKISIVLNDRLDYSNGAAFFLDNKIEIWLPALDSPLRGTHDWLRNVITHEFVHMIQIQSALKGSRKRPATYIQWLSYEDVRRPDVLYGYPSGVVTYPLAKVSMPAWLAEGTAQYQAAHINYDYWDSHRDMILRTRILDDSYLPFNVMGTFASKTSIEREVTYNQGFAFTNYLAETYGEEVLRKISEAYARPGVWDVSKALKIATGTKGETIFQNWISSLKSHYQHQIANRSFTTANFIEYDGFYNFHPQLIQSTGEIVYLSNRGRDDALVRLYIRQPDHKAPSAGATTVIDLSIPAQSHGDHAFTLSCGHTLRPELLFIQSAYSVSPDGNRIYYNRIRETMYGEPYNDIYVYDRTTRRHDRLSIGARISEPSLSPDGKYLTAGLLADGSVNMITIELEKVSPENPIRSSDHPSVRQITQHTSGQQIYRPVWHPNGQKIYFAYSDNHRRQIHSVDLQHGNRQVELSHETSDYRDPSFDTDGNLYFSSDSDGIFNIYRRIAGSNHIEQITSVKGGAFMPTIDANGTLIYSEYVSHGYTIASLEPSKWFGKSNPNYIRPYHSSDKLASLMIDNPFPMFDDTDLNTLPDSLFASRRMSETTIQIPTFNGTDDRTIYPYKDTFTSFSVYPAIRFDNYSKLNGSNSKLLTNGQIGDLGGNLWRDIKTGFYFASREMIDRFSLFGGAMIGIGSLPSDGVSDFVQPSRLVDLDRDLFLMAEYRGLPFIKRSWSPTISVELYNIRRNVKDGLSIEEFPCTPCLPDTTSIGIAYDVWEAQVSLISKLNRFTVLEIGWHHSPYRVSTNAFFSREFRQTVPGSSSRYFIGNTYTTGLFYSIKTPHRHSDITLIGLESSLRYKYQPSRLLEGYDIRGGVLIPVYNNYKIHSLEFDIRQGFRAAGSRLFDIRSRFYTNFNGSDEYFFLDYIGGLPAMRSYSFFALGGNTTWFTQLNYHHPIFEKIHHQQGRFTIDKVFTRLFLETGNGWGGPLDVGNNLKSGIGAELRFSMSSYYLFPTRFFISGAYGLNSFDVNLPESFITTTGQNSVTYGREILFNFGLLFDFNF